MKANEIKDEPKRLSRQTARKLVRSFCGIPQRMKLHPEVARDFKRFEDVLCDPHYVPSLEGTMWLPCDLEQFCELAEAALEGGVAPPFLSNRKDSP